MRHLAEVQQCFGTTYHFAGQEVPMATPEGLILLKLDALPSRCRQGLSERVSVYEGDSASLMLRHRPAVAPLLQRLEPHLETGDRHELRGIVRGIAGHLARFDQLGRP